MSIKIIADSSCDLNKELKERTNIKKVPLTIQIDDNEYLDNEEFDVQKLLRMMKASKDTPKTASPAPNTFMEEYKGEESVFVVTLSSKLSSTYKSALLAKKMFLDTIEDKFIHVFDSVSASVGETMISLKIFELAKENYKDSEIVEKVNEYIKEMKTFFVLESLDNLIKAGRMSKVKGKIASFFSIKPIMGGTSEGEIELVKKVRGSKRALQKLVDIIGDYGNDLSDKVLGIAHCNCLERAERFKERVLEEYDFKDVIIVEMGGLSSVYANDGGIVIAF